MIQQTRPQTATERIISFMLQHETSGYNYALNKILELELRLDEAITAYNKLSDELKELRKEIEGLKANATLPADRDHESFPS